MNWCDNVANCSQWYFFPYLIVLDQLLTVLFFRVLVQERFEHGSLRLIVEEEIVNILPRQSSVG